MISSQSFDGITEFVAVAETKGFTSAAKKLNVSTSHVSRQIAKLESRLGVALFARSTRNVKLTDVGRRYYQHCTVLVDGVEHANQEVVSQQVELTGTLRVSAAGEFAEQHVVPELVKFAQMHPQLKITHAVAVFKQHGFAYDIASIKGGSAPLYGTAIEDDKVNANILADSDFQSKIKNTQLAAEVDFSQYDAVFYPGGFGLLSDLAINEQVAQLTASAYEGGAVVGAVCHGPAGLLPITLSNGKKLIEEISVTGFTREEEVEFGTIDNIPFLLEESLVRTAGRYVKVAPWGEFVTSEAKIVTGQNPASAHAVAEEMINLIG